MGIQEVLLLTVDIRQKTPMEISLAIISSKTDSSRILNAYLRPDGIKCFLPVMEKSCQKNFLMK